MSINLFGLLCDGLGNYSSSPLSAITRFGGPITYLVIQAVFAFAVLVYVDSGSPIPAFLRRKHRNRNSADMSEESSDVTDERERVKDENTGEELIVRRLRKKYSGADAFAVNDVSFGVSSGQTFALVCSPSLIGVLKLMEGRSDPMVLEKAPLWPASEA